MATNQIFDFGKLKTLMGKTNTPTTPASGSPVLFGTLPGVCLVTEGSDGYCSIAISGAWSLKVYGLDGSGGSAVNNGDKLYINASTQVISKVATDVFLGWATDRTTVYGSQLVASGATGTITVTLAN